MYTFKKSIRGWTVMSWKHKPARSTNSHGHSNEQPHHIGFLSDVSFKSTERMRQKAMAYGTRVCKTSGHTSCRIRYHFVDLCFFVRLSINSFYFSNHLCDKRLIWPSNWVLQECDITSGGKNLEKRERRLQNRFERIAPYSGKYSLFLTKKFSLVLSEVVVDDLFLFSPPAKRYRNLYVWFELEI